MLTICLEQLSERTGVPVEALRDYEFQNLLPPPRRTPNGYNFYDDAIIERIQFIQHLTKLNFSIDEVAMLLNLKSRDQLCSRTAQVMLRTKAVDIELKIKELNATYTSLLTLEKECQSKLGRVHCAQN